MSKNKVLITGGCGYIGSHTIVDLCNKGFDVISIDNLSRSNASVLLGVEKILDKKIVNYEIDLCDLKSLENIIKEHSDILGIVHFAAFKSVPESIEEPLLYYHNNIISLMNLLKCCERFSIENFVFSSSCSVYGDLSLSPVSESTPIGNVTCPYAQTKQMGEQIIKDFCVNSNTKCVALRYFNPVGAHNSGYIGEIPHGIPGNLFPIIMETALNKRNTLFIHGNDYDTRDGSCIRDFVHVCDIAEAHSLSLSWLLNKRNDNRLRIFNLGTGKGISITEVIKCFEITTGVKLNYKYGPRRSGDIPMIFADNNKAKNVLNWLPKHNLESMIKTAFIWAKKLN